MKRSPTTSLPPPEERRRLRESHSLTQAQLARRVGVSRETVRAWEAGRAAPRGRKGEAYVKLLTTAIPAKPESPRLQGSPAPSVVLGSFDTLGSFDLPGFSDSPGPSERTDASALLKSSDRSARSADPHPVLPVGRSVLLPPVRPVRPTRPERSDRSDRSGREEVVDPTSLTPAQAFDALYAFCAPTLVRQTYLLSGRRGLARESVERAFQLAWDRWPEVARDRDPAGWVRAAAYEWALSPWHRFRRRHRHPEPPPSQPSDRALLGVLLHLPPPYRRAVVLYDGVGLDLPETAAETEASTTATASRLLHAHEILATRLPELSNPLVLHRRLAELASAEHLRTAEPPEVREGSERRAHFWTRSAIAFTLALIGATAITLHTAPTRYDPPVPSGETVQGVPPHVAPGPLSDKERKLRAKLREELLHGPERLAPQPW
ncbi:helix-turn-helix domain-containing protein [Streptomyces sp. MAR25Y5]|uniref:helix-turn-helix domain-containing protein n=1 Tax=Streptomyces sp. MAR25Y5 TaxID=2962028 RepID=UPI0020B660DD|nr:helix-turn-helix domain-containing protein [Streptomyces sp. MAR25Y5]MCP3766578.1 helix-turn-helix domain-containing protein [Streptomyces sp. MAR25Y5]